ncbi:unnamed protein product [Prorocentrum cordatum]|uniref:Glycosyltransferase 2-like domain-containing protein n=1 Tax=Prorocentrum cordatum TaxID=2364126 RepID=A0ABN9T348_9DINO|nr:unnamed protein product [Polarella glacialis]
MIGRSYRLLQRLLPGKTLRVFRRCSLPIVGSSILTVFNICFYVRTRTGEVGDIAAQSQPLGDDPLLTPPLEKKRQAEGHPEPAAVKGDVLPLLAPVAPAAVKGGMLRVPAQAPTPTPAPALVAPAAAPARAMPALAQQTAGPTAAPAPPPGIELIVSQFRLVPLAAGTFAAFTPRANVSEESLLSPAQGVYEMMNLSSAWPRLGYCRRGQSLLPQIPDSVCDWRACVEVDGAGYGVDRLLLGRRAAVEQSTEGCHPVAGGQTARGHDVGGPPLVSFVYTLHNNPIMSSKALLAAFRTAHEVSSAEFVLLDDCSSEDMTPFVGVAETLESVFGTRIQRWRTPESLGYTFANTVALKLASGTYACLMNSDVFPLPGWLAAIFHTLRTFPGAGIVGPLQVSPDARVMEAGGTVFRQGHAYNIGRRAWPWELPYLHSHVVDYI